AATLKREGSSGHQSVARAYYAQAATAVPGVGWLRDLSGPAAETDAAEEIGKSAAPLMARLERVLDDLGTMHDQKFAEFEKAILEGLAASASDPFENGHKMLGTLLGFEADNENSQGAPDPWWFVDDNLCFVFEDHSDAQPDGKLSIKKARQVASHPNWIRDRFKLSPEARVIPVLVTSQGAAEEEAAVHLKEVAVWHIDQFREWAVRAVQTVRQLRVSYPGAGDIFWRQEAMEAYATAGIDPDSMLAHLKPLGGSAIFRR
ncbi:MAG: hypothetical protein JO058_21675, partial [Alphaproteobacteria bacterium]|nr:hypothetical protein [Alphaproteobacteria bacterium]